jgi:hypothetical protein
MATYGQLRHRFWGEYSARVVIASDTPEESREWQSKFAELGQQWTRANDLTLFRTFSSDECESEGAPEGAMSALQQLARFAVAEPCQASQCKGRSKKNPRVVRHAIDGIEHSIDHGPLFRMVADARFPEVRNEA